MFQTINEITKRKQLYIGLIRGIVYSDDNYIEFGYFKPTVEMLKTNYEGKKYFDIRPNMQSEKIFSLIEGRELLFNVDDSDIELHKNVFGNGYYPYSIPREYEAEHHIDIFEQHKTLNSIEDKQYDFSKELKYSFGIEFETASGYLPENKCFELGLIPLRDGSISGVEYSTIPMSGNKGMCLLNKQLKELKKYTYNNKECSVHVHLGGYPVNPKALFILHSLWYYLQYSLNSYIPKYSYETGAFKRNGKNYCNHVVYFDSFKEMFQSYVGQNYMGSLYQPHPDDVEKRAKWNIKTRYFNCNFINMLCYNAAKTVEFRFLTPTYSFDKLSTFLLIFNGILKYAEMLYTNAYDLNDSDILRALAKLNNRGELDILNIMKVMYSEKTFEMIKNNLKKLEWLKMSQEYVGDFCGSRLDIENRYFPDGKQEN